MTRVPQVPQVDQVPQAPQVPGTDFTIYYDWHTGYWLCDEHPDWQVHQRAEFDVSGEPYAYFDDEFYDFYDFVDATGLVDAPGFPGIGIEEDMRVRYRDY